MPIYCDESGFTGVNLIEENQPYFVYSALNISTLDANEFVDYLKKKYSLQGKELKGSNLLGSNKGKLAIAELFHTHAKNVKVIFHDKKFALACKYFEYVFEPVIAEKNIFFYQNEFHLFIANILHEGFLSKRQTTETLFKNFISLLKGENEEGLFVFLSSNNLLQSKYWKQIAKFTFIHRKAILDEITDWNGEFNTWVLDLHGGSLYNLLCSWGTSEKEMEVICDESKPLAEAFERTPLIRDGAKETVIEKILGKTHAITYTLKQPILLIKSQESTGIQLADMFSSSVAYSLRKKDDSFSKEILSSIAKYSLCSPYSYCVLPDHQEYFKSNSSRVRFNAWTLKKFVEYSENNLSILENYLNDLAKYVITQWRGNSKF